MQSYSNPFENALRNIQGMASNVIQGARYAPGVLGGVLNNAINTTYRRPKTQNSTVQPLKPLQPAQPQNTWSGLGRKIKDYTTNQQNEINKINQLTQ